MSTCNNCGAKLQIGDWPFCRDGKHDSTRPELAQRFKPIIVFKSTDGRYSFPMHSDQPLPKGYRRVEITTRRQAERLEREVSRAIREEKQQAGASPLDRGGSGITDLRRLARGESVTIPDHDAHGNLIYRTLDGSQMRSQFREYIAQLADRESAPKYSPDYDPGFHIDIMHNSSSNRAPHDDASSGWRSRKD